MLCGVSSRTTDLQLVCSGEAAPAPEKGNDLTLHTNWGWHCTAPLRVQCLRSRLTKMKKKDVYSFFSENVMCLKPIKPQTQHLNLVPNPVSRVVVFVSACVFEGVAIKTRRLVFKSKKSHQISTLKGQRIRKKKNFTHTMPIQEVTLYIGPIIRKYKRASFY